MRRSHRALFRYCIVASCTVIVASGCQFPRNSLPSNFEPGTVVPGQYCPGDTLTASYNLLTRAPDGVCTPRTPGDCEANAPRVTMSSTPTLFPTSEEALYQKSIDFAASGDRVDVHFDYPQTIFIPIATFVGVRDHTETATRITAPVPSTLPHGGTCSGLAANYVPVEVPRLPRFSPNVVLQQVVNVNGFPVRYRIAGSVPGEIYETTLNTGERIDTSMPGVPVSIRNARMIEATPMVTQMCSPGSGSVDAPPSAPPLNTQVITGCP